MSKPLSSVTAKEFNAVVRKIVKATPKRQFSNVTKKQRNHKLCGVNPSVVELAEIHKKLQAAYPHNKVKLSLQKPAPFNGSYFNGIRAHVYFDKPPVPYVCPVAYMEKQQQKAQKALQPKPRVLSDEEALVLSRYNSARINQHQMQDIIVDSTMLFSDKLVTAMEQERAELITNWLQVGIKIS